MSSNRASYFAGGGFSPEVSTFCVSVTVVEPPGVVTVVSFLTSAFFSQPTVNGTTRLKAKQRAKNRFMSVSPKMSLGTRQNVCLIRFTNNRYVESSIYSPFLVVTRRKC